MALYPTWSAFYVHEAIPLILPVIYVDDGKHVQRVSHAVGHCLSASFWNKNIGERHLLRVTGPEVLQ